MAKIKKMFIKTARSLAFFILVVGLNSSIASAASMKNHHKANSPKIVFSKLNIKLSDKLSNKPQRGRATTTIRQGKPNWTVSEGKPPEGLRPWMGDNQKSYRSSEKKSFVKKTQFYKLVIQHFCPVHGEIMEGAYCEIGFASFNNPESFSKQKECFIAIDGGGFPVNHSPAVFQIDHKFAEAVMSDGKMTLPFFVFSYFELIDYSQGYFNSPDKPPKLLS